MKENHYRVGVSQIHPYRYYYLAFSPLKGVELDGRVTEVIGVKANPGDPYWSGYGNQKDKYFGFKYQFIKEDKFLPAIALSIMDPTGTRVYPSQSIIASKQLYPFDFTLGFGNGRFGKTQLPPQGEGFKIELFSNPRTWAKDSQFFWGIQWAISDHYALMVEYSPIQYEKQTRDPAQAKYFQDPVPSQFNYGLRWRPFKFAEVDISYQRGEEFGVNLSMNFDIGQPIIPIYDQAYRERQEDKTAPINKRLTTALHRSGFSSIGVLFDRNDLWVRAQNDKYYYSTRAIGVITKIINDIVPPHIQNIHITLTDNGISIFELDTTR
ncbi:MAG: YjbH domain-containing protein, partial [Syntrophorhabdaceae bacterium]|nr:YjbH domain-containing protein [Syntrophorhabdaceae bacterium]